MIFSFFVSQEQPDTQIYLALPSPANPRVILPLGSRRLIRAAWQVHNTAAPLNRLLRFIALALSPLLSLLRSRRVYPTAIFRNLLKDLQSALPQVPFSQISLYVGTFGSANQKLTLQLMDDDGTIFGYLKLAGQKSPAAAYLQNEMRAMAFLSKQELSGLGFPVQSRLLPLGNYLALYQEAVFTGAKTCGYRLTPQLLQGALELARATQNSKGLSEFYKTKKAELKALNLPVSLRDLLQQSLQRLAEQAVPTVAVHGDFVPYNLKIRDGKLIAIDWEFFRERGLPLHDLLGFVFQGNIYIFKKKPKEFVQKILNRKSDDQKILLKYIKHMNIREDLLLDLFGLYLSEMLTLHKTLKPYEPLENQPYFYALKDLEFYTTWRNRFK